jgi:prepilin signal peptidase PulO-like enzyme (type II secretory pathway)
MLCFLLLAELKSAVPFREPFPSPEQIWAIGAALAALWLFAMGGSVGSFINVVVYRLPAGLNLSSPGSRCPRCLHPIRLQHNLPIIGWLMLRGRCADCQLPISSRYPLVELLLGTIFLLVGGIELIGNGVNLPRPSGEIARPVLNMQESRALGAAATLHLVLISTLVCAALIEYDGQRIPKRIALPVIVTAIAVSLTWPAVHPIAALELVFSRTEFPSLPPEISQPLQSPWLDIILGGFAGVLAVAAMKAAIGSRHWLADRYGGVMTLLWMVVGMVFGWQLVPLLLLSWSAIQLASPKHELSRQLRPVFDLTLEVLIALLMWRLLVECARLYEPVPYLHALGYYGLVTLVAIVFLSLAAWRLPLHYEFPRPVVDEAFLQTPPAPTEATASNEPATTMYDGSPSPHSDIDEPKQP